MAGLPSTSCVVPKATWVRGASGLAGLLCSAPFCSWGCSSYSLCSASEPSRKVLETKSQRAGNLFLSKAADLQGQARWPCRNEELWLSLLRHGGSVLSVEMCPTHEHGTPAAQKAASTGRGPPKLFFSHQPSGHSLCSVPASLSDCSLMYRSATSKVRAL